MSHIAVYTTTLGNVNVDILKKALEVLALSEENLEVRDYIKDYYNNTHKTWNGLKIIGAILNGKTLPRGIGVALDDKGNLKFVGEAFGSPDFNKIKGKIEQTYKLVALIVALQNTGYDVQPINSTTLEATLNKKKITVELKGNGEVVTDLEGFTGRTCYEEALKLVGAFKETGVNVDAKEQQAKPESLLPPDKQRQRT